ncbi:MAG: M48 family metalloprotease [Candidatus Magasanikbacteria bacterium]
MYSQIDANKRRTVILMMFFIAFILGLGYFLGVYMGFGYEVMALAIVLSVVMNLAGYFVGDKIALKSTGAKEIKKQDNPYVFRMVENLCLTAGIPMPKVHIIQSTALNAFATGRDPEHASIALTTGIIERLENEELEGVIAHELSHIQNYDIRVMMIVVVLVGSIALLSDIFFRMRFFGGGNNNKSSGQLGGILMIAGIALLILSPIIAELIKLSISRKREYLADASGALLTRYPEGLAKALEKISGSKETMPHASAATAHLFISNPFKKGRVSGLFSTHPPIVERVKKLRGMV